MREEKVVLVDKDDNQIGLMPKMEAHLKGKLHRAFSIIIFNSDRKILLQKRASTKYHTPIFGLILVVVINVKVKTT